MLLLFQVLLLKTKSLTVQSTSCECKAGRAKCSHLVGLLYTLAHFKKMGMTAVPPVVSKTSKPQQWHLPSRDMGIHLQKLDTLTVSKVKPKHLNSSGKQRVSEGLYCPLKPSIPWQSIVTNMREALHGSIKQLLRLLPNVDHLTTPTNMFGSVPHGSVLAMQQHQRDNGDFVFDQTAFPFPCMFSGPQDSHYHCALTKAEQDVWESLHFDLETCRNREKKTPGEQSKTALWKSGRSRLFDS